MSNQESKFYILYSGFMTSDPRVVGIGSLDYIKSILDEHISYIKSMLDEHISPTDAIFTYETWHMDGVEPETWEFAYIPERYKVFNISSEATVPDKAFWGINIIGNSECYSKTASEKKLYGWYSAEQTRQYGSNIWSTPNGLEIEVSEVRSDESPNNYPDAIFRGPVVKWVRYSLSNPTICLGWCSEEKNNARAFRNIANAINAKKKSDKENTIATEIPKQKDAFYKAMKELAQQGLYEGAYEGTLHNETIEALREEGFCIFIGIGRFRVSW